MRRRTLRRGLAAILGVTMIAAACNESSEEPAAGDTEPVAADANGCFSAPVGGDVGTIRLDDATDDLGLTEPLTGMHGHATALGDVNGDGWTDVFVGTFADRDSEDYSHRGAEGPSPDRLLLGGLDGFRVDETFPEMHGRTSGAAFADFDGDGLLDLVIARNVRTDEERGDAPSIVLRNIGGRFEHAAELDSGRSTRSVGILDADGDGLLDVYLLEDEWGDGSSVLLRNLGDFEFDNATDDMGLPDDVHGLGVSASDLTGDGLTDLFVAGSNRLFVNTGAHFEEADGSVFEWETYGDEDTVAGVAAGDVNRDGRPDLLVGHHFNSTVDDEREVPVRLYLNDGVDDRGHPRFRDVTEDAGLSPLPTKAPHVEIVDLDGDGWPDLLTSASADDGSRPAVFRNVGAGAGEDPEFEAPEGLGDEQYWIAGATFDANHDGRVDVFLVEWEPTLPSPLFRNATSSGHWIAIGGDRAAEMGARVEVFEAGGLGEADRLLGSAPITASVGYSSGSEATARFGVGDVTSVDVLVRLPGGDDVELRDQAVDRRIMIGADC